MIQVDALEEMFDVAQLLAHQPLPRGRRVAVVGNSDALGLLAADAAAGAGLVVNKQVALGAEAGAEDFEDALDAAIDDPDVDAVAAIYIPPLNVSGEDVANVLAAIGEQSDKPLVTTFLGAEGVPELLRVPDAAGSTAGRGSVPSYPAVEAAVRALARVVEYAMWLRSPATPPSDAELVDRPAAKKLVSQLLIKHPDGHDLGRRGPAHPAGGVRHRPVAHLPGRGPARGARGGGVARAGTSCSRRPRCTCGTGPTWPTCGATSTRPRRWRTPGTRSAT